MTIKQVVLPEASFLPNLGGDANQDLSIVDYWSDVFSPIDGEKLMATLSQQTAWRHDTIRFFGKTIPLPRLTAWYGDPGFSYTYSGIAMQPLPWNDPLNFIKNKVETLCNVRFNSVLLNLYRDGNDKVGWHSDDEHELGKTPVIASVSLGATRVFKLRRKPHFKGNKSISLDLDSGSVLVMAGDTQLGWEHELARTAKHVEPRINLTFRQIFR